jgi:hypothetical protein
VRKLAQGRLMQLETLERRDLLSGLATHLNVVTDHLGLRSHHGDQASIEDHGDHAGTGRADASAPLDPPFPPGQFEVSGKNFPVNFTNEPTFSTFAPQSIADGRMQLTISAVRVTGSTWVDLSFQAPTTAGGLADSPNNEWQAGPIKDIKVKGTVNLKNESFYFTTNNVLATTPPKSGADFVVRNNPLKNIAVPWGKQPDQVYFFKNFKPGTTFDKPLNLGTGIKYRSFTELLKLLNIPNSVNNLHFDFEYTFPMR